MKDVTAEDIRKIAHLSRLSLQPDELKNLTSDFNEILHFVEHISEVDTENVEPLEHIHGLTNVFREDKPVESLPIEKISQNAPAFKDRFFVVPRVIEENR